MKTTPAIIRCAVGLAMSLLSSHVARSAETPSTGTVEGRVLNPANGEYLESARVTVEGTALEGEANRVNPLVAAALASGPAIHLSQPATSGLTLSGSPTDYADEHGSRQD